jgi:two-component system chemotaxis sensor kinase CheA
MAKDPYRYFRIEAAELLDQMTKGVLDLEKGSISAELVMRLLRLAHTLKGAARVVKQAAIADFAHRLEDILSPYRDGAQSVPRDQVDQALAALDAITAKLTQLPQVETTAPSTTLEQQTEPTPRAVRTDLIEVDTMLEGLAEINTELGGVRRTIESLASIQRLAAQLSLPLAMRPAKLQAIGEEIQTLLTRADLAMSSGVLRIVRELREVRDAAERLRLVPISSIFNVLERTARDAAHSLGKQVEFNTVGGELRIDGTILELVQSALVQIVRNAVAHGIDAQLQRMALGKPAAGQITVTVERRGYRAWIRCQDDGAGIDLAAVRRVLQKNGLAPTELDKLDADALMTMLLKGGISTTSVVTEISGRGIGLDVVRAAIQKMDGEITATSVTGQGTTFDLAVPLSLAALDALIVECDGQVAALPLDAVRCTLRISPEQIVVGSGGRFIVLEGHQIPFRPLRLINNNVTKEDRRLTMKPGSPAQTTVVVATAEGMVAMSVDRLRGTETVVLRSLPQSCPGDPVVLGVYLDDEGKPRMILDPDVLEAQHRQSDIALDSATHSAHRQQESLPILIIDDSLTTRMLECSILESAGYQVEMAVHAEEGWEMAHRSRYALFLVDVEMPGMDGFTFVKNTQNDQQLRTVPSILVSSRDAPEDRKRGLDSGARAYIVKGEFDQIAFLELIEKLVRR